MILIGPDIHNPIQLTKIINYEENRSANCLFGH